MKTKRTNIEIDPQKMANIRKMTGLKTSRAIVDFALKRLIQTSKSLGEILKYEGKVSMVDGYSYKRER